MFFVLQGRISKRDLTRGIFKSEYYLCHVSDVFAVFQSPQAGRKRTKVLATLSEEQYNTKPKRSSEDVLGKKVIVGRPATVYLRYC